MNETEQKKEEETTTEDVPVVSHESDTSEEGKVSETVSEADTSPVADTPTEVTDEAAKSDDVSTVSSDTTPTTPIEEDKSTTEAAVPSLASIKKAVSSVRTFVVQKKYTVITILIVVMALVVLVYALETSGRLQTNFFAGIEKQVSKYRAAATVYDATISQYDLELSVTQLSSSAEAQGADLSDPAVQAEIENQALEMLINTELLKHEATSRGITVADDEVTARLDTLRTDVGGEEVLNERMAEFGINQKTLLRDIRNELTIQKLLDEVFKEKSVSVSDEEIAAFYDQAGGTEAGLPALEDVRTQIEAQLKATKEQTIVTEYIEELRAKADIKTHI